jgi:hypothetical protein
MYEIFNQIFFSLIFFNIIFTLIILYLLFYRFNLIEFIDFLFKPQFKVKNFQISLIIS